MHVFRGGFRLVGGYRKLCDGADVVHGSGATFHADFVWVVGCGDHNDVAGRCCQMS